MKKNIVIISIGVLVIIGLIAFFTYKEKSNSTADSSYTITYESSQDLPTWMGTNTLGKIVVYRMGDEAREDYFPTSSSNQYRRTYFLEDGMYICNANTESGPWMCVEQLTWIGTSFKAVNPFSESFSSYDTTAVASEKILGLDARCFRQVITVNYQTNQTEYATSCLHPAHNIILKNQLHTATKLSFDSIPETVFEFPKNANFEKAKIAS